MRFLPNYCGVKGIKHHVACRFRKKNISIPCWILFFEVILKDAAAPGIFFLLHSFLHS